ncbi:HAD family hydrolase [Pseudonocardia acaciae]|uniref:HAD family hydrolase n=1 Tax=Pseudonocardia acaciae TaxID=551276 RepID=UPI00056267F1|nr:HAD hydrolase-like protein [Pseudonocardia acaciae]
MKKGNLHYIVAASRVILFDFDGPICSLFAGVSAGEIAELLIGVLRSRSAVVDRDAFDASDPLDVLQYSARFGPSVVADVEDELIRAELEVVRSAAPTPAGAEAIRSCVESGRRAAVVSNNAASAVVDYLSNRGLDTFVHTVVGRTYGAPQRMKPSAEPVERALEALSAKPSAAVLVGDSPGDILAAQAAATASIGFANRPSKWRRLAAADVIIDDMAELAAALDSAPVE